MAILYRYNEEQIPIDILRMICNRSKIFSVIILINGHGQVGKSTFVHYLANRILQIRYKQPNKWNLWNWQKFSSTNAQDFVRLWNENNDKIINLSEAGEQLNYLEWFSIMAKVFASTTRTQGMKHNICILDTPMSTDVQKHNKENIDFKIWVAKRYDSIRMALIKPRFIRIDYLQDKWKLGYIHDWLPIYPLEALAEAKKFTNWLLLFKEDIAQRNLMLVGIYNPNKPISEKNMPDWVVNALNVV